MAAAPLPDADSRLRQSGRISLTLVLILLALGSALAWYDQRQRRAQAAEAARVAALVRQQSVDRAVRQAEAERRAADARRQRAAEQVKSESDRRVSLVVHRAVSAVKYRLVDQATAHFRFFYVYPAHPAQEIDSHLTGTVDVACGEVNARGPDGRYVGFRGFYWDSLTERAVLDAPKDAQGVSQRTSYGLCDKVARYQREHQTPSAFVMDQTLGNAFYERCGAECWNAPLSPAPDPAVGGPAAPSARSPRPAGSP